MTPREITIAALQRERQGYVNRGLEARVKLVDAELAALGVMVRSERRRAAAASEPETAEAAPASPVETASAAPRRKKG